MRIGLKSFQKFTKDTEKLSFKGKWSMQFWEYFDNKRKGNVKREVVLFVVLHLLKYFR